MAQSVKSDLQKVKVQIKSAKFHPEAFAAGRRGWHVDYQARDGGGNGYGCGDGYGHGHIW